MTHKRRMSDAEMAQGGAEASAEKSESLMRPNQLV
jgi:hypothetical protein